MTFVHELQDFEQALQSVYPTQWSTKSYKIVNSHQTSASKTSSFRNFGPNTSSSSRSFEEGVQDDADEFDDEDY
jgi:hypothetical protein